jgi:3'(2'), 5'-bisphosphate nucleotidase
VPADHLTTAMELSMNPAAPQRAAAAPDGPPAAVPAGPGYPPAAVPAAADGPSAVVPAVAADPPADDAGFAAWLAGRAGELLLRLREEIGFDDPAGLRDAGDRRSHDLILAELAAHRPADAVLSEEGVRDAPERLTADRVWIVDPLDGTREYGEAGRTDWAVHIALWSAALATESQLLAGAVALPAQGRVLVSDPAPAYPVRRTDGPPRLVASRSRAPQFLTALAGELDAEWVPLGSAGAKISAVVDGDVDLYVHAGGQYEWDSAAPVAVAQAAGLHTSRLDGSPLTYNHADPWLPDLVVCRVELADRLLALLKDLVTPEEPA